MNELLWLCMLVVNFGGIMLIYRIFGKMGLFVWIPVATILANIQVVKTIELFGFQATLGNIAYATTFLVTDILSENYGKRDAQRAVFVGFFSLLAMAVIMNLALYFKPGPEDFAQEHLVAIFSLMPRLALASFAAFAISQVHDVWAFHWWKDRFPATRFLWLRNNASTAVSQLLDTGIFVAIAFVGVYSRRTLVEIFVTTFILKAVVAALDTPFVYAANWLHSRKHIPES